MQAQFYRVFLQRNLSYTLRLVGGHKVVRIMRLIDKNKLRLVKKKSQCLIVFCFIDRIGSNDFIFASYVIGNLKLRS
jgi:hypothetical protein